MAEDDKARVTSLEQENAALKAQLSKLAPVDPSEDVRARAVADAEAAAAEVPTPTQAELDAAKRGEHSLDAGKAGGYRTRQAKAN